MWGDGGKQEGAGRNEAGDTDDITKGTDTRKREERHTERVGGRHRDGEAGTREGGRHPHKGNPQSHSDTRQRGAQEKGGRHGDHEHEQEGKGGREQERTGLG